MLSSLADGETLDDDVVAALPGAPERQAMTLQEMTLRPASAGTWSTQTPSPSGRFQPGQVVALSGLLGHVALNGVQGLLIEFDERTSNWVVELEGFEDEFKHVPERNLQELQLSIVEAEYSRTEWNYQMQALEEKADEAARAHEKKAQERRAEPQKAARRASSAVVQSIAKEHEDVKILLKEAFAEADMDKLREGYDTGCKVLKGLELAPVGERLELTRLVDTAKSRIQAWDEREKQRETKRKAQERILRGEAPDWKMTTEQFWKHADAGEVLRVRGGLRAKQPLSKRDGKRRTIVHAACRLACADAQSGVVVAANRAATVEALLDAKANPNAVDIADLTPLDLAIAEGGEGASSDDAAALLEKLRALGLRTYKETLAELRAAAESNAPSQYVAAGGSHPSQ